MNRIFMSVSLLVTASASALAYSDDFNIYGTLAQGYFLTDRNNYFGDSTRGSFDFRELGIGASYKINDNLRASGLLMSRKAGKTADGNVDVDYLMLDYTAFKQENSNFGIRVGRQKQNFGFYNETRDVAETRPSILLPQSIYFDNARKFLINADGVQLYGEHWSDGAYTKMTINLMSSNGVDNKETELYFLGADTPGHLKEASFAKGIKIEHVDDGTEFSAYFAVNPIQYVPGTNDYFTSGKINISAAWLSARHTFEHFIVTSEVFTAQSAYSGFGAYLPDFKIYPLGAYVQGEWIASEKWQFYSRYDMSFADSHDLNGTKLAAKTGKPATAFYAKDTMIGGRYRFTPTTSLSAEIHYVRGTVWLPASDNTTNAISPDYNIFAMQLSHSF